MNRLLAAYSLASTILSVASLLGCGPDCMGPKPRTFDSTPGTLLALGPDLSASASVSPYTVFLQLTWMNLSASTCPTFAPTATVNGMPMNASSPGGVQDVAPLEPDTSACAQAFCAAPGFSLDLDAGLDQTTYEFRVSDATATAVLRMEGVFQAGAVTVAFDGSNVLRSGATARIRVMPELAPFPVPTSVPSVSVIVPFYGTPDVDQTTDGFSFVVPSRESADDGGVDAGTTAGDASLPGDGGDASGPPPCCTGDLFIDFENAWPVQVTECSGFGACPVGTYELDVDLPAIVASP